MTRTRHQREHEARRDHPDHGLPGGVLGGVEGLQQIAQLPDVMGRVRAVEAHIGERAPGTALGGAIQQLVEVLLAQEDPVVDLEQVAECQSSKGSRKSKPAKGRVSESK